jgi:hypothetical protein
MADKLILVQKGDTQIRVHPNSLENHLQLGWSVVEPPVSTETAEPDKTPKPDKAPKLNKASKLNEAADKED